MSRARLARTACGAVIALIACRDAPEPFSLPELEPLTGSSWRLTYNFGDDRSPSWTADGQRIIYTAEGLDDDTVNNPGLLVSIPYTGGTAERVFPSAQTDTGAIRWFTTPAVAPLGDRLAFGHIIHMFPPTLCGPVRLIDCVETQHPTLPEPQLDTLDLRVRLLGSDDPLSTDLRMGVKFAGRTFDPKPQPGGLQGFWRVEYHPFHQLHVEEGVWIFRPSWSPDGSRIALSDGLRLLIRDLASGTVQPVPGTADGVTPAWSPDGAWIAFTRLERGASRSAYCQHLAGTPDEPIVACAEERTEYELARRALVLVRPDGSEFRELGEGEEPAWGPEGQELFYRFSNRIWRRRLDGDESLEVPETSGGREPAVSPDGRHLAISRPLEDGSYAIWIVRLEE